MNPQTDFFHLCQTSENVRDAAWEEKFLTIFPETLLTIDAESPILGPDGFSYLFASQNLNSRESAKKILKWLAGAGVGLVVNGHKSPPDYVFNFGSLWWCERNGSFQLPREEQNLRSEAHFNLKQMKQGEPSEVFLPAKIRSLIREFLVSHESNLRPKLTLLTENGQDFDLAFSLSSLGNPPENERDGLAEAISWFLPPHYAILFISEDEPFQFHDL